MGENTDLTYYQRNKDVSATINNKRTFLPRCWISRVFCSFTGILLPLCALMVVADLDIPGSACRPLIYFFL